MNRMTLVHVALALLPAGCAGVRAPEQPGAGFGGGQYVAEEVRKQAVRRNGAEFFLFEPVAPKLQPPGGAPVVIFLHGWLGINPALYGGWLDHLARRGNVVIWPRYQPTLATPPWRFTPNMMDAVREAVAFLRERDGPAVDLSRVVVVGHSAGGILAANYAAMAAEQHLPAPKAIFAVHPGNMWVRLPGNHVPPEDWSRIPADTLLLALIGQADVVALDREAREIVQKSTQIPPERKRVAEVFTDAHGSPKIPSDHLACLAQDDAYDAARIAAGTPPAAQQRNRKIGPEDYLIYWRLLDALIAAPPGRSLKEAIGAEPGGVELGKWSDGRAIRRLEEK